ncbi:hypothetical protein ACFQ7A_02700 [Streptomyces sp. NPDC056528]|uniref:hypothetical protein n=1 Tax=Streptomyces sp. NPDC056528 TaxID=3345854 RepID=UPI0036C000DD
MLTPKVDFPELLPEVAEPTGTPEAFAHISGSGSGSGVEGFTTSLCAVPLSEACGVGTTPVVTPDVPGPRPLRAPRAHDESDDGEAG